MDDIEDEGHGHVYEHTLWRLSSAMAVTVLFTLRVKFRSVVALKPAFLTRSVRSTANTPHYCQTRPPGVECRLVKIGKSDAGEEKESAVSWRRLQRNI
jgi:hypothetical protein